MTYTVQVTLEVDADSRAQAYYFIKHALDNSKKQELRYIDMEVTEEKEEHD